jgi:hypothetical protein
MAGECFDADIASQRQTFFAEVEESAVSRRLAEEETDIKAKRAVMCIHLEKPPHFKAILF